MTMNQFKFFQKKPERVFTDYMDQMDDYFLGGISTPITEQTSTIEFLIEYCRRLDYQYVRHHRIFTTGNQYNQSSYNLFNSSIRFIRNGQLTTTTEVRRYLYLSYRAMTGVDYDITPTEATTILVVTYNYLTQRNERV